MWQEPNPKFLILRNDCWTRRKKTSIIERRKNVFESISIFLILWINGGTKWNIFLKGFAMWRDSLADGTKVFATRIALTDNNHVCSSKIKSWTNSHKGLHFYNAPHRCQCCVKHFYRDTAIATRHQNQHCIVSELWQRFIFIPIQDTFRGLAYKFFMGGKPLPEFDVFLLQKKCMCVVVYLYNNTLQFLFR